MLVVWRHGPIAAKTMYPRRSDASAEPTLRDSRCALYDVEDVIPPVSSRAAHITLCSARAECALEIRNLFRSHLLSAHDLTIEIKCHSVIRLKRLPTRSLTIVWRKWT